MIQEYKLVCSTDSRVLNEEVAKLIKSGWELFSGCAVAGNNDGTFMFVQTLVKYDYNILPSPLMTWPPQFRNMDEGGTRQMTNER